MDDKHNPHAGHRARVRGKVMAGGLESFHDHEVIEYLLFHAVPRQNTNELAHRMLRAFGTFDNLLEAEPVEIMRRCGVGEPAAALIGSLLPIFRRYRRCKMREQPALDTSRKAGAHAVTLFIGEQTECFYLICLDNRRRPIYSELISRGGMTQSEISLRVIVDAALKHNCVSVILSHNHPSGLLAASNEDVASTRAVIIALKAIQVEVLDHIIVAGDAYMSFSEKKMLGLKY